MSGQVQSTTGKLVSDINGVQKIKTDHGFNVYLCTVRRIDAEIGDRLDLQWRHGRWKVTVL